jgi:hypothetical protein
MPKLFRPVAIFLLLYLASSGALYVGLPRLMGWHVANCADRASAACSVSAAFLSYWWIAVLPVIVTATVLFNRTIAKRHAA